MNIFNFRSDIQDLKCSRLYWIQRMEVHVHQVHNHPKNHTLCLCNVSYNLPRYDKKDQLWKMRHARNTHFLATSKATERSLLLGSHSWVVHNDSEECSKEGLTSYKINLTLHACEKEEFACCLLHSDEETL